MEWKFVKTIEQKTLIQDFETYTACQLPMDFKEYLPLCNGGRPCKATFDTDISNERCVKSFLSFNPHDRETIWNAWRCCPRGIIPFASDHFGNYIAFYVHQGTSKVVFFEHETMNVEFVARNFTEFLEKLS